MPKRVIIHVGAPKSGTTSLQNNVFSQIPTVRCLGKPNHLNKMYKAFFDSITLAENYDLDQYVVPFVSKVKSSPKPVVMISDEMFAEWNVFSLVASRLARYFPDAQILITIRSQFSAIPSYYVSHGRMLKDTPVSQRIRYVTFREYFDFYSKKHNHGHFRHLKYYELARTYAEAFGRENITILTFEEMVRSPATFFEKVGALLDASPGLLRCLHDNSAIQNKGDSGRFHSYLRLRSKIPIRSAASLLRLPESISDAITLLLKTGKREQVKLSKAELERIVAIYGPGNAALEREFDITLSPWGYPLSSMPFPLIRD
jgi:Sulfotransferase domain